MSSLWVSQYQSAASSKLYKNACSKNAEGLFYLLKSVSDIEHFSIVRVVFEQLVVFWDHGLLIEPHEERRVAKIGLGYTLPKSWIGKLQKLILCNLNGGNISKSKNINDLNCLIRPFVLHIPLQSHL